MCNTRLAYTKKIIIVWINGLCFSLIFSIIAIKHLVLYLHRNNYSYERDLMHLERTNLVKPRFSILIHLVWAQSPLLTLSKLQILRLCFRGCFCLKPDQAHYCPLLGKTVHRVKHIYVVCVSELLRKVRRVRTPSKDSVLGKI